MQATGEHGFLQVAEDQIRLHGQLSFANVPVLLRDLKKALPQSGVVRIDLSAVTRSDSAGLALLVDCLREARKRDLVLQYVQMPEQMLAMARVTGLDAVLPLLHAPPDARPAGAG